MLQRERNDDEIRAPHRHHGDGEHYALVKHLTARKGKRCGRVADGRPVVREAGCQVSGKAR